jgi:hypothetical protein
MMHKFNDDFGALANLAIWKTTGEIQYLEAFNRFINNMLVSQNSDGGFGIPDQSVPSAGGAILIELLAAKQLSVKLPEKSEEVIANAAEYLINLRYGKGVGANSFLGFDDDYKLSKTISNARTSAYSILALMRMAGVKDDFYFFT